MALTDPLTGLPNRRHLERCLTRAMTPDSGRALSLAIFDVNDFKSFNDRHGHIAGDEALASVGRVLSRARGYPAAGSEPYDCLPARDHRSGLTGDPGLTARLGGDEFVAVFPDRTAGQARDIAGRLAMAVAHHPALAPCGVTVSFGVASRDATMNRYQELLAAADRDLYRSRASGSRHPMAGRRDRIPPIPRSQCLRYLTRPERMSRSPVRVPIAVTRTRVPRRVEPTPASAMNPSPKTVVDLHELERTAEELARAGGEVALGYFGTRIGVETKSDDTPVTVADRETESLVRAEIERRYPEHGIFGEEHGEVRAGAPVRWIVDPIDGTRSFVHGVPLWGVLIGIEVDGEPVVGVAHFPALRETVTAARGRGCRWNGEPCSVSPASRLDRSLVLTSDETAFHGHPSEAGWRALVAATRMTRSWGDCYGHVLVATGRAQVMVDPVLAPWDAAPFMTILTEAGGCFTDVSGKATIHGGSAVSSNPALHPRVLELLAR